MSETATQTAVEASAAVTSGAVKATVAGGSAAAARMGIKSPAVLNSKVNPNTDIHHLALVEASKLMALTNGDRIPQSLNAQHGKVAINLPEESTAATSLPVESTILMA